MRAALLFFVILFSSCSTYPRHWWAEVPRAGAPSWEILPQEALPGEVILSKRNELGILSNFAPTPFVYRGKRYASVEGFWQMMLIPNEADRERVSQLAGFAAKSAGMKAEREMKRKGIDWVSFEGERMTYCSATPGRHYQLIKEAMWEKLQQNPDVRRVLKSTRNLRLRPDHHAEDCQAPEWKYYEIWMEFRKLI